MSSASTTNHNEATYLGREGKVFGPYTETEVRALSDSGEFIKFTWMWDYDQENWMPINFPPPPPVALKLPRKSVTTGSVLPTVGRKISPLHAICHNNQSIISGDVVEVFSSGLILTCNTPEKTVSPFKNGMHLWLHLCLDEDSGKEEKVGVILQKTSRKGHVWRYTFQWDRPPHLLQANHK